MTALGQWSLPDRTALSEITVVDAELKKRPRKTRKRKHDEDTEDENVVEVQDIVPVALTTHAPKLNEGCVNDRLLGKIIPTSKLTSTLTTLKLSAVVKLLKLMQGRRRATIYLIEHLIDILAVACPRVGVKSLPWAKNETPSVRIHGDVNIILSEIEKLLPILWSTLSKTVSYFRDQLNSSAVIDTESDVAAQLTDLFRLSLITLERLFSWCHVSSLPNDPDGISRSMKVRRDKLMETIEHCILREDNERNAGSEAEHTVFDFLVDICEVVPCISVAVAVLDCVSVIRSPNEALNNKMARHALAFLKKEWTDKEGKQIKGATLIVAVRKMLSHYLHLRPINNRLCAIQWMLAKKLADLVPHDERRKSKVYEQESDDPDLNERDTNQVFACFTRYCGCFVSLLHYSNSKLKVIRNCFFLKRNICYYI
uniref:FANCI_S4 domain-containing protein n=1 Tax=Angiostrongylus cantonensis TaxID=6313 RepID=A0A158P7Y9_ANGCA